MLFILPVNYFLISFVLCNKLLNNYVIHRENKKKHTPIIIHEMKFI